MCPKFLCRLRGSPQKLGSNLGPISPKHYQKPRSKKYAEPRQINEIANHNLTTNQLISLNAINKGDTVGTPVTKKDVRFIANTPVATTVLNSPSAMLHATVCATPERTPATSRFPKTSR